MRIAIFGGTGFVGFHLIEFLSMKNIKINALVRNGSEHKILQNNNITSVSGDIKTESAITETIKGCDYVIYNIGILEESPKTGSTFKEMQYQGLVDVISHCSAMEIKKFILMSANGIEKNITDYQRTKLAAENYLMQSGLNYTIFRPSVIFGDPKGRMEFATQLLNEMIIPPIPAVNFFSNIDPKLNSVMMSPVHVNDVVEAIYTALNSDITNNKVYNLGGPYELSWIEIIKTIMTATKKEKLVIPMPIIIMKIVTQLFSWIPFLPVTYDQIIMLEQGNTASPSDLMELIERNLLPFDINNLNYLTKREDV